MKVVELEIRFPFWRSDRSGPNRLVVDGQGLFPIEENLDKVLADIQMCRKPRRRGSDRLPVDVPLPEQIGLRLFVQLLGSLPGRFELHRGTPGHGIGKQGLNNMAVRRRRQADDPMSRASADDLRTPPTWFRSS